MIRQKNGSNLEIKYLIGGNYPMNKLLVICAVLVCVLAQTELNIEEQGWQIQRRQLNYPITPRNFNGYDFNTNSAAIRYLMECNQNADMILLTGKNHLI